MGNYFKEQQAKRATAMYRETQETVDWSDDIEHNFTGTTNWKGGLTMIHDQGPEIVDLPNGTRILPHAKSLKEAEAMGRSTVPSGGDVHISVAKIADSIVVREDADIDKIAQALVKEMKKLSINRMEGAIA